MLEQEREFNFNMKYFDELKKSMEYLGGKKDTLFIGQAVEVPGTAMSNTLKNIDKNVLLNQNIISFFTREHFYHIQLQ